MGSQFQNPLTNPLKKLLKNILYIFHYKVYLLSLNPLVNYNKYPPPSSLYLFPFRLTLFWKSSRFFQMVMVTLTLGPYGKNGPKGRKLVSYLPLFSSLKDRLSKRSYLTDTCNSSVCQCFLVFSGEFCLPQFDPEKDRQKERRALIGR